MFQIFSLFFLAVVFPRSSKIFRLMFHHLSVCAREGFVPVPTRFKVAAVGAGRGREKCRPRGLAADSVPRQWHELEARQRSGTGTRT
jgi:hypothetical protein